MAACKTPECVRFSDALPKTSTGKRGTPTLRQAVRREFGVEEQNAPPSSRSPQDIEGDIACHHVGDEVQLRLVVLRGQGFHVIDLLRDLVGVEGHG